MINNNKRQSFLSYILRYIFKNNTLENDDFFFMLEIEIEKLIYTV